MQNIKFFGLLHLEQGETSAMNVKVKDFHEQVNLYVRNAKLLSSSLKAHGLSFSLLTNDRKLLADIAAQRDFDDLNVIEIECTSAPPKGIKFYSAHFKHDAFNYLSTLSEDTYTVLSDLDVVCLTATPESFKNIAASGMPLAYDISDQVIPAYGRQTIIRDMDLILGQPTDGRWYGGEFIGGKPSFFRALSEEIRDIIENYYLHIKDLHHVGDEAYTTCAIAKLKNRGIFVQDAGTLRIVGRYLNASVRHPQKPFDWFSECFLLHLPADKAQISALADEDAKKFLVIYQNNLAQPTPMMARFKQSLLGRILRRLLK